MDEENKAWYEFTEKTAQFLGTNKGFITNALHRYADHMRAAAQTAQAQFDAAQADPEVAARYDRSLMSVNGLKNSMQIFEQEADKAARLAAELETLVESAP